MLDFGETKGIVPVVFKGISGTKYKLASLDMDCDGISNVLNIQACYKIPRFAFGATIVYDFHFWEHKENINGMRVIAWAGGWGDAYCKIYEMHFSLLLNSGKLVYNNEIDFLRELERGVKINEMD